MDGQLLKDLAVNAGGAFIGAIAAFAFALWLARIQNAQERKKRFLEEHTRDLISIRSAVAVCWQNIEECLAFKRQIVLPLEQDAATIRALLATTPTFENLLATLSTLPNFFKYYDTVGFATLPDTDRFAFLIDEVPSFISFLHRAAMSQAALNSFVGKRNADASGWAGKATAGATPNEIGYYLTMLLSHSEALRLATEDVLYFHQLLADQCYYVGVEKFQRPRFPFFAVRADHLPMMPAENWMTGFRERLVTFGHAKPTSADAAVPG